MTWTLSRARHSPGRIAVIRSDLLVHSDRLIARATNGHALSTVQHRMGLGRIVDVRFGASHRVHQPRVGICTDVRLHAEVPLIAFLGRMRLVFALALLALCRVRRSTAQRCSEYNLHNPYTANVRTTSHRRARSHVK